MPNFEKPPVVKVEGEPTDDEMLEAYRAEHPELFPEERALVEHGPMVEEFEELCRAFENQHDLAALHAVVELPATEAEQHPVREPARRDLVDMQKLLKRIDEETDITDEAYAELYKQYNVLSLAVGIINRGIVDHTRESSPRRMKAFR